MRLFSILHEAQCVRTMDQSQSQNRPTEKEQATRNCRAHHNTARHSLSRIHVTITLQYRDNERVKLNFFFCPFAFMQRTGTVLSIIAFAVH